MTIELWSTAVLGVIVLLILWSMIRTHRDEAYREFNLLDIITCQKGKVSRPACLEVGSFLLLAWALVIAVNKDKWEYVISIVTLMTGVFVLRAAHSAYLSSKNQGVEVK